MLANVWFSPNKKKCILFVKNVNKTVGGGGQGKSFGYLLIKEVSTTIYMYIGVYRKTRVFARHSTVSFWALLQQDGNLSTHTKKEEEEEKGPPEFCFSFPKK